jgi:[protein-PII] uridylyltransferase
VKDIFGMKVDEEHKLAKLRESLLAALAEPGQPPPAPADEPPARRRAAPARARVAAE